MSADRSPSREALAELLRPFLVKAPSHQGGHSDEGMRISKILGIPFPITMSALAMRAEELGLPPEELWPWRRSVTKETPGPTPVNRKETK